MARAGPELDALGLDAPEGAVEDEQRVVLSVEVDARFGVVESDSGAERQAQERSPPGRLRQPEQVLQNVAECCSSVAATAKWSI
jgi:hypothetical protein